MENYQSHTDALKNAKTFVVEILINTQHTATGLGDTNIILSTPIPIDEYAIVKAEYDDALLSNGVLYIWNYTNRVATAVPCGNVRIVRYRFCD